MGTINKLIQGIQHRLHKTLHRPFGQFNLNWFQEKYFKHASRGKEYSFEYRPGIKIYFTDPQAFMLSIQELFIDEIYKFRSNNTAPFIIDCGAHIGMSILSYKMQYSNAKIMAFEPDSHNYNLCKTNIEGWAYNQIELVHKAVWTHNENIQFDQLGDMGSSITGIIPITSDVNPQKTIVQCARLKDYLNQPVDFLKIDIEGAEYEVLKDCAEHLSMVSNIFIEYHGNYHEMQKLNDILQILTNASFSWYIKEAGNVYPRPMYDVEKNAAYDVQLNIFGFRRLST